MAAGWDVERILAGLPFGQPAVAPVAEGLSDDEVVEALLGPEGLTEKACGFGRRDVLVAAERLLGEAGVDRDRLNRIADRVLSDERVLHLLAPAQRNNGEVLTICDERGHPVRRVCTQAERRYTTLELVEAELEVLRRVEAGRDAGLALVPDAIVEQVLAGNPDLDPDRAAMVATLCSSGNAVDIVEGRAGTGKSYGVGVYRQAAELAGLRVIGLAPSATAAHLLGQSAGIADTDTVHGLLARLEHTGYQLPGNAVIVLDEAAMCDTRTRLALQRAADAAGVKVVDLGDDRQAPSVDAGGLFTALKRRFGAVELTVNHRFDDFRQRDAAEQLRDGQAATAVAQLDDLGLIRAFGKVADAHEAMVAAWLDHLDAGEDARMYADTNRIVADLNILARDALLARGRVARRGHTYTDAQTGRRILLAEGDRVRLGRNDARLHQPDGQAVVVRNGMEGTVLRAGRRGLEVRLDDEHASGEAVVVLPAGYVAADVDYGYAVTCDKAQGSTVDHALYHPTDRSSSERAYVALSRGRKTNKVYAVQGSGWEAALANRRAHTIAADQQPARSGEPRVLRPLVDRDHAKREPGQGRPIAM